MFVIHFVEISSERIDDRICTIFVAIESSNPFRTWYCENVFAKMSKLKAYLVKELQMVIAFVCLNHLQTAGSKKGTELEELMFHHCHGPAQKQPDHGSEGPSRRVDPLAISFMRQCIEGLSVFEWLFEKNDFICLQQTLSGGLTSPVRLRLNPLLLPGDESLSIYVGHGPSADIRMEHIEKATLTGNALISGRTLFRHGKNVQCILRKAEALVPQCLGSDGEFPSGTNRKDFLKKLYEKFLELYGKDEPKNNGEDKSKEDRAEPKQASLTQGVAAQEQEDAESSKKKWTYTLIPCTGWFAIALFVKKGIAGEKVEDRLPLLKNNKNYSKQEKKNHTRTAVRSQNASTASRERSGRTDLATAGTASADHLNALLVQVISTASDARREEKSIAGIREQLSAAQKRVKFHQFKIQTGISLGKDVSVLMEEHDNLLGEVEEITVRLSDARREQERKRAMMVADNAEARKVARLVNGGHNGEHLTAGRRPNVLHGSNVSVASSLTNADGMSPIPQKRLSAINMPIDMGTLQTQPSHPTLAPTQATLAGDASNSVPTVKSTVASEHGPQSVTTDSVEARGSCYYPLAQEDLSDDDSVLNN